MTFPCGNWGGFSFEIETSIVARKRGRHNDVATGAASRLRLKHRFEIADDGCDGGGNWGGFSFEIETCSWLHHPFNVIRGNWGGFSFEIETKPKQRAA